MKYKKTKYFALALIGILLGIFEHRAAFVYSAIGLFLLTTMQLSVVHRGKPIWMLIGGKPTEKFNEREMSIVTVGLIMLVSGVGAFVVKVAILTST
jgi:hypothetical protein